jgi:hypothetical protein
MGVRRDKARAITRYLSGHSAIPTLYLDPDNTIISGPPPYGFRLSTDRNSVRFFHYIKEAPRGGINPVIRYDGEIPELEDAIVGIRLSEFVQLIAAHYKSIEDRVQTHIEGA